MNTDTKANAKANTRAYAPQSLPFMRHERNTPRPAAKPDTLQYIAPWEVPFLQPTREMQASGSCFTEPPALSSLKESEVLRLKLLLALTSPLFCGEIVHPSIPRSTPGFQLRWDLFLHKHIQAPGLQVPVSISRLPQDPDLSPADISLVGAGMWGVYFVSPGGALKYHFPPMSSNHNSIADFRKANSTGAKSFLRRAKHQAIKFNYVIHRSSQVFHQLTSELDETRKHKDPLVAQRIYAFNWVFECGCTIAPTLMPITRRCTTHGAPYVTPTFRSYNNLSEILPDYEPAKPCGRSTI